MQALERILAILESVSRSPGGLAPVTVAESTGLPLSTVVRFMQTLQDAEVLHRSNDSNSYRIGPRLIGIVGRSTRSFDTRVAAVPVLERLRDRCGGETAALHMRDGSRRVCIAAAYTTHLTGRIVPIGLPLPLVGSAVGEVLLAQMTDDAFNDMVDSFTLSTAAADTLRARVAKIQREGFVEAVNQAVEGVRGVAVPVRSDPNGAALSVSGPSDRFIASMVETTLESLRHAADTFEQSGMRFGGVQAP